MVTQNLAKIIPGLLAMAVSSFGTAPDLPMAGWATQNGGTTGGAGKTVVTVSNVTDLRKYAEAGNYTIYVKPGTYKIPSKAAIKVGNNVTIFGYQGAVIEQTYTGTTNEDNTAMSVEGKNIIIRNLVFKGPGAIDKDAGDCLHVKGGTNVWIDHVEVYDGEDGNLDVINGANYVTISWTKFHYTNASTGHQFSNLIGNSDSKTSDRGLLKTTLHHNWWANGVKERMPRVRFGQVHVANNLFSSNSSSTCVRAAKEADLRVENNVFIGVNNPIDLYNGDYTGVYASGNFLEGVKKGAANGDKSSAAFTPSYKMNLTDVSVQAKAYALKDSIEKFSGATLANPDGSDAPTSSSSVIPSSSSVASSSSVVNSSSSVTPTSSSSIIGAATLTKHGSGSATQQVLQGAAVVEFYYSIVGATGAKVTGLPEGVSGALKGLDFYISGTVSATAAVGDYKFTVTTTGASQNVSKTGTITVIANTEPVESSSSNVEPEISSSSTLPESSSSIEPESSSSEGGSMNLVNFSKVNFTLQVQGHSLMILGASGKSFAVFDMQGRALLSKRIYGDSFVETFTQSGTYLVRIGNTIQKVNIR